MNSNNLIKENISFRKKNCFDLYYNTSLAAPGALAHCLQRRTI